MFIYCGLQVLHQPEQDDYDHEQQDQGKDKSKFGKFLLAVASLSNPTLPVALHFFLT